MPIVTDRTDLAQSVDQLSTAADQQGAAIMDMASRLERLEQAQTARNDAAVNEAGGTGATLSADRVADIEYIFDKYFHAEIASDRDARAKRAEANTAASVQREPVGQPVVGSDTPSANNSGAAGGDAVGPTPR
jgi:hypothetical protein